MILIQISPQSQYLTHLVWHRAQSPVKLDKLRYGTRKCIIKSDRDAHTWSIVGQYAVIARVLHVVFATVRGNNNTQTPTCCRENDPPEQN